MAFWTTTKRVARYGFIGFVRNGFISLSAVLILTITLFVMASLLIGNAALNSTLAQLKNEVQVTVYFTTDADPSQEQDLQQNLESLPEVQAVTYVPADQALAQFQQRHQSNQLMLQALTVIGDNPLGAELQVRAKDPSQYAAIAQYLDAQQSQGTADGQIIDTVNYDENQTAITHLNSIVSTSRAVGTAVAIVFGLASLLIAFNTIRLAIYTSRDEIGVMSLVGASHWYVRGPFMVSGVLYGLISGVIVLLILYPTALWLGAPSQAFLGSFNVFSYFLSSFGFLLLVVVGSGVALGALSSYLAVRRYLMV